MYVCIYAYICHALLPGVLGSSPDISSANTWKHRSRFTASSMLLNGVSVSISEMEVWSRFLKNLHLNIVIRKREKG